MPTPQRWTLSPSKTHQRPTLLLRFSPLHGFITFAAVSPVLLPADLRAAKLMKPFSVTVAAGAIADVRVLAVVAPFDDAAHGRSTAGFDGLHQALLIESLLLATVGGGVGVLIASPLLRGFLRLAPADIPRLNEVHLGLMSLGFIAIVCVLATL